MVDAHRHKGTVLVVIVIVIIIGTRRSGLRSLFFQPLFVNDIPSCLSRLVLPCRALSCLVVPGLVLLTCCIALHLRVRLLYIPPYRLAPCATHTTATTTITASGICPCGLALSRVHDWLLATVENNNILT